MQVVEVVPIVRGITKETLTYFAKDYFEPGSFVLIPVRNSTQLGIVISSKDARLSRSEIRQRSFPLKKLARVNHSGRLSKGFIQAAKLTADFYASSLGSILGAIISKTFLEDPELIGESFSSGKKEFNPIKLVQLPEEDRWREYRSLIRESLARKKSILFIVPTQNDVSKAVAKLSVGIENYVFSGRKELSKASKEHHAIVFVSTPSEIAFTRIDLHTIIVERENSQAYRTNKRPYINHLTFIKFLTRELGKELVLGDCPLSLETLYRERETHESSETTLNWKIDYPNEAEVVDMRAKLFELISPELDKAITKSLKSNEKIFLFGVRKGLAPSTVCGDCGSILLCTNCGAPLVLHEDKNGERLYRCHRCGAIRTAETRCDTCGSWKLKPLGIGTNLIVTELEKKYPETPIYLFDRDHVTTATKAVKIIEKFNTEGGILVGTELALSYLKDADLVGVVSLDSLFSIPDYSINEKIFILLTRLRNLAKDKFLLQTRNVGQEILSLALTGDIHNYFRSEIASRAELSYPPFSIFIRVSTTGKRGILERKAMELQHVFKEFEPHFMIERGQELGMLIRTPRDTWPDGVLLDKLLLLSPDFLIKVDPETLI